jgi:hypothetical protein
MIYRKGDEQGLSVAAANQDSQRRLAMAGKTDEQKFKADVKSGVQGARNAVNLKTTVAEATSNPDTLGGPVSGSELSKLKAKKSADRRTNEREKNRIRGKGR